MQDNYKWRPNLTFELGLRYEWNRTPTERYDRFIVFDERSASLLRVGDGIDRIYHQNAKNIQPRVGFAWAPEEARRLLYAAATPSRWTNR